MKTRLLTAYDELPIIVVPDLPVRNSFGPDIFLGGFLVLPASLQTDSCTVHDHPRPNP